MVNAGFREGIFSGQNWEVITPVVTPENNSIGPWEAHKSGTLERSTVGVLGEEAIILMAIRGENEREAGYGIV